MKYIAVIVGLFFFSCQSQGNSNSPNREEPVKEAGFQELDTATLAGGCFWCIEAAFEQIQGVEEAVSGYAGGDKSTADYALVSSGNTGHAEAVQVYYDPSVIDYETILEIFFTAHDPTQLNRQGPDVGPQYRSEIFFHNDEQRKLAEAKMEELAPDFSKPIVTKLSKLDAFYMAEEYHQDYEEKHPNNGYILNVSKPKIEKVAKKFKDRLKKN
ncbi:peptide-methionine (S)-S-oxide reductase [Ekhidna lutea]|uniref:Peptide methionine sulfoxide reductase MsrA n=1 Tax=Ekhidna lutea TaxID=447679 RepID=A0A239FM84_EKHLU|nr:peptide-methionine (S)-S-oxide reductase MsrA [Ekhidna lutea]SNS57911.1 peptide-methionine (S)-S-oxide reductase [Ekhidna lutea]